MAALIPLAQIAYRFLKQSVHPVDTAGTGEPGGHHPGNT